MNNDIDLEFLQEIGVCSKDVERSGLSIATLKEIKDDYEKHELTLLDEAEYIAKKIQRCEAVHSVRWRIKNASHVIKKIVRKLDPSKLNEKYKGINSNNYKTIITDLIGVRAIYLFKSDWEKLHEHILSRWILKGDEPVIIYHREGDNMDIYSQHPDCQQEVHISSYRSTHYVVPAAKIDSEKVYCEIQTRTIFEEGWSEIDHKVRYPDYSEDENLKSYLTIFNRLAGSADEMGSYVNELLALIKNNIVLKEENRQQEAQYIEEKEKLQESITEALSKQNDGQLLEKYKNLISLQEFEISRLNAEIVSQSSSTIKFNREPMVIVLKQEDKTKGKDYYEGEIEVEVTRRNRFASFTGHFKPMFDCIPRVEVTAVEVSCANTEVSDLDVKIGVGQPHNFNVHIFNKKLHYIEEGTYKFHFKAYAEPKVDSV